MSLSADSPLPALRRDIELVPVDHESGKVFAARDPEADGDAVLALSPGGAAVAVMLDGTASAGALAARIKAETGQSVPAQDILDLAKRLEEAGLLDSEKTRRRLGERLEAFRKAASRPARFKGPGGYPDDAGKLRAYLEAFGGAPAKGGGKPVVGLVSPHIDMHRGGKAYAQAYAALAAAPPPDLVVGVGVAHASPPSPWAFTRKDYETPLGAVKADLELYDEFAKRLWYDPLADEWVHRREHSLEFQAVWLKHVWPQRTPRWLPILCSSFERFADDRAPSKVGTVEDALKALGEVLAARAAKGQRVLVLAGVDLAHVGPRFGDDLPLTPETEKKVEAADRASLDRALTLEADAFYLTCVGQGAWRKVCGNSALYTSLRWISALTGGKARGELLAYGQAPDPAGGIVSFAGAAYR